MKKYNFILLLFTFMIFFCGSSCDRKKENKYFITIRNNSDKEIIFDSATAHSIAKNPSCFKLGGREYSDFINDRKIKPYSSKKWGIDLTIEFMQTYPNIKAYSIGIFYRTDIETMTCEEFRQKYPIKKEWNVTLADFEACNFDLVLEYTPED